MRKHKPAPQRKPANIVAVVGATGTGKTYWIEHRFLQPIPSRLMIWSHKPDYVSLAHQCFDLGAGIRMLDRPQFRLNYCPPWAEKTRAEQFDLFCKAAMAAKNLTVIVEELHMVTSPSYAPSPWREVSCMGREYGLIVVGTSQRPAHMDKDFLSNATDVVCFRVNEINAQRTMANALDVDLAEIKSLANYEFFHRVNATGTLVATPNGRPTASANS